MKTIRLSNWIYGWATEYHVFGFSIFKRGWCLMEFGAASASPIIYTAGDGLTTETEKEYSETLRQHVRDGIDAELRFEFDPFKDLSFERSEFTSDRDRPVVRGIIEQARGSVASFDAYLRKKVTEVNREVIQDTVRNEMDRLMRLKLSKVTKKI